MQWHRENNRPLPWVGEKDPYKIWVSEIILQQTRVEQGTAYFHRFLEAFPDIHSLAAAPEELVLKRWEGLGYYSRARNMLAAARQIAELHSGHFPETHEEILKLKGIGPYTAAAIASFAFNLPHAVVDGNVERLLARLWGIDMPVDTGPGKNLLRDLGTQLLDPRQPGKHNQAMMDFGATSCTPRKPLCTQCPFQAGCQAFLQGKVDQIPVKSKKAPKTQRFFHYLVLHFGEGVWIKQRSGQDIWAGLHEFPLIETQSIEPEFQEFFQNPPFSELAPSLIREPEIYPSIIYRQTLSHQTIHARFWEIHLSSSPQKTGWLFVPRAGLREFAFPRIIRWYFEEKNLSLNLF